MSQPKAIHPLSCVICDEPCGRRDDNPLFPFCSRRCQLIDLARWLDGDYCIPGHAGDLDRGDPDGGGPESDAFM